MDEMEGIETTCHICCEDYIENDYIYKLPCDCKYVHHKVCIEQWFNTNQTCPLCSKSVIRSEIQETEYDPKINLKYQVWYDLEEPQPDSDPDPELESQLQFNHPATQFLWQQQQSQQTVYVYRMNYNLLRYKHGMAGLAFSA